MAREKRQKIALITGIAGQDGAYLAEFLLKKNYKVFGLVRKSSNFLFENIAPIQHRLNLIYADLLDSVSIVNALEQMKSLDEVYNLASQSAPSHSFKQPIHTAEITGIGAQRVMESVFDKFPNAKFYQASSSEMYGWVKEIPQSEETPFNPANPYAVAKLYAHNIAKIYRSQGRFIACGILFNHESPKRGLGFVTQKVAYAAACAKLGIRTSEHINEEGEPIVKNGKVSMGNLKAQRDWGYSGDFVEAMWAMLQLSKPDDFVIGTGEVHSIEDLCREAFSYVGKNWKDYVIIDKRFVRPTETGPLVANPAKAKKILKWQPKMTFKQLVETLVDSNVARLK
ncbi:GDP-mannose 4,6-dehydratase [Candidatus Microgenomates bacterium]|nr:GDP-mannose 4,6-dehydratase [Candidatus Microgenomates bacterium]